MDMLHSLSFKVFRSKLCIFLKVAAAQAEAMASIMQENRVDDHNGSF